LVVVPSDPVANFVVRQSRLTLGAPKAFFDSKVSFCRTTEFRKWSLRIRVAQIVVGLDYATIAIAISNNEQNLVDKT
jgi:hypothetical protein